MICYSYTVVFGFRLFDSYVIGLIRTACFGNPQYDSMEVSACIELQWKSYINGRKANAASR